MRQLYQFVGRFHPKAEKTDANIQACVIEKDVGGEMVKAVSEKE